MKAGSSDLLLFLVIGAVVGAGVGYAIGRAKGRPGLGLVLGLLLGWIGWVIIALIPRPSASVTRAQKPSRGWYRRTRSGALISRGSPTTDDRAGG